MPSQRGAINPFNNSQIIKTRFLDDHFSNGNPDPDQQPYLRTLDRPPTKQQRTAQNPKLHINPFKKTNHGRAANLGKQLEKPKSNLKKRKAKEDDEGSRSSSGEEKGSSPRKKMKSKYLFSDKTSSNCFWLLCRKIYDSDYLPSEEEDELNSEDDEEDPSLSEYNAGYLQGRNPDLIAAKLLAWERIELSKSESERSKHPLFELLVPTFLNVCTFRKYSFPAWNVGQCCHAPDTWLRGGSN